MSDLRIATMTAKVRGSARKARLVSLRHSAHELNAAVQASGPMIVTMASIDLLSMATGPRAQTERLARLAP